MMGANSANSDVQNPQLPRLCHRRAVLLHICRYLDLLPPRSEPEDPLGRSDRIPYCRPLRTQLGDSTVQVLDQPIYHLRTAGQPASCQPVLALPDSPHPGQLHLQQCYQGRALRRRGVRRGGRERDCVQGYPCHWRRQGERRPSGAS